MKKELKVYNYPNMENSVVGYELETGDILQQNDVYNSSSGKWEKCPCPGLMIQIERDSSVIWVRPDIAKAL